MEDFGEYTPLDSVSARRRSTGTARAQPLRDRIPLRRLRRGPRRGRGRSSASSARAGPAPRRCAQVVWGGDPTTGLGFDGLRSAVTQALSARRLGDRHLGLGHRRLLRARRRTRSTPELLIRWVQLGAVSPVMRTQANGVAVPPKRPPAGRSTPTSSPTGAATRSCTPSSTRTCRGAAHATGAPGMPPMRHLALAYPGDAARPRARTSSCSAPTCSSRRCSTPGATQRSLYLPRGRWIDLWRSVAYRERARRAAAGRRAAASRRAPGHGAGAARRAAAAGPRRRGAAAAAAEVDTLAAYGDERDRGLDTLAESRDRCACSRSRAAARRRGSTTASEAALGRKGRRMEARDPTATARRTLPLEASLRPRGPVHAVRGQASTTGDWRPAKWSYDRRHAGAAGPLRAAGGRRCTVTASGSASRAPGSGANSSPVDSSASSQPSSELALGLGELGDEARARRRRRASARG